MSLQGSIKPGYMITGRVTEADYILMTSYGIALQHGFKGTEEEWLASLKGTKGDPGYTPQKGVDYFDGAKGDKGDPGYSPVKGVDYFTEDDITAMVNEVIASLTYADEESY